MEGGSIAKPTPDSVEPPTDGNGAPKWPHFRLTTLFLITVVFSVMASAGHYLVKELRSGGSPRAVFIIFTLAAPMLLATLLSILRSASRRLSRRSRR